LSTEQHVSTEQHELSEPPLVVQRWCRYGHDRAYVKRGDADLGYRDLRSGEVVASDGQANSELVAEATAALYARVQATRPPEYVARHARPDGAAAPSSAPAVTEAPRTQPLLQPDRDLATNRPGERVREKALELRSEAPVRTLVARLIGAKTDERSYRLGADGEQRVALRLGRLDGAWRVLHSIPVGRRGSDLDHLLVGPAGVFAINAKHHPQANVWVGGDTVKVNGHYQPYVRNSRFEAHRAARLLSDVAGFDVDVFGLIAVVGAERGLVVQQQPRDGSVVVVAVEQLDAYVRSLPPVLGHPSIARIYEVARHLATWQPDTVAWQAFKS
jgi:hypothetical protein